MTHIRFYFILFVFIRFQHIYIYIYYNTCKYYFLIKLVYIFILNLHYFKKNTISNQT